MLLSGFTFIVLFCAVPCHASSPPPSHNCSLPGFRYWPGAFSPQGTISSWSFDWVFGGRLFLAEKCKAMPACVGFSNPGDLKGTIRPVERWSWTPFPEKIPWLLAECKGLYVKTAVAANIPEDAVDEAREAAYAAAARFVVRSPIEVLSPDEPIPQVSANCRVDEASGEGGTRGGAPSGNVNPVAIRRRMAANPDTPLRGGAKRPDTYGVYGGMQPVYGGIYGNRVGAPPPYGGAIVTVVTPIRGQDGPFVIDGEGGDNGGPVVSGAALPRDHIPGKPNDTPVDGDSGLPSGHDLDGGRNSSSTVDGGGYKAVDKRPDTYGVYGGVQPVYGGVYGNRVGAPPPYGGAIDTVVTPILGQDGLIDGEGGDNGGPVVSGAAVPRDHIPGKPNDTSVDGDRGIPFYTDMNGKGNSSSTVDGGGDPIPAGDPNAADHLSPPAATPAGSGGDGGEPVVLPCQAAPLDSNPLVRAPPLVARSPPPIPAADEAAARRTTLCNDSASLIPGFVFYPNRFMESTPHALAFKAVILDEMTVVKGLAIASVCVQYSWCSAFDTVGRIWGDVAKIDADAELLRAEEPFWRGAAHQERGVCSGTYLRVGSDKAGCFQDESQRKEFVLYNDYFSPGRAVYDSAPAGTDLNALLAKCTADARCRAVQYPDMLLLNEQPIDALMYDRPWGSVGARGICDGTYMRMPEFLSQPTDPNGTVVISQRIPSQSPEVLNITRVRLDLSAAAALLDASGAPFSFLDLGYSGSALVLITLTLTCNLDVTIGDAYGIITLNIERPDGSALSYNWYMRAPSNPGVTTGQTTLYAVPLWSSEDVVTVDGFNILNVNSTKAHLQVTVTVQPLVRPPTALVNVSRQAPPAPPAPPPRLPPQLTPAPPPGLMLTGASPPATNKGVFVGLLVGAVVGGVLAVVAIVVVVMVVARRRGRSYSPKSAKQLGPQSPRGVLPSPSAAETPPCDSRNDVDAVGIETHACTEVSSATVTASASKESPSVLMSMPRGVGAALRLRDIPDALRSDARSTTMPGGMHTTVYNNPLALTELDDTAAEEASSGEQAANGEVAAAACQSRDPGVAAVAACSGLRPPSTVLPAAPHGASSSTGSGNEAASSAAAAVCTTGHATVDGGGAPAAAGPGCSPSRPPLPAPSGSAGGGGGGAGVSAVAASVDSSQRGYTADPAVAAFGQQHEEAAFPTSDTAGAPAARCASAVGPAATAADTPLVSGRPPSQPAAAASAALAAAAAAMVAMAAPPQPQPQLRPCGASRQASADCGGSTDTRTCTLWGSEATPVDASTELETAAVVLQEQVPTSGALPGAPSAGVGREGSGLHRVANDALHRPPPGSKAVVDGIAAEPSTTSRTVSPRAAGWWGALEPVAAAVEPQAQGTVALQPNAESPRALFGKGAAVRHGSGVLGEEQAPAAPHLQLPLPTHPPVQPLLLTAAAAAAAAAGGGVSHEANRPLGIDPALAVDQQAAGWQTPTGAGGQVSHAQAQMDAGVRPTWLPGEQAVANQVPALDDEPVSRGGFDEGLGPGGASPRHHLSEPLPHPRLGATGERCGQASSVTWGKEEDVPAGVGLVLQGMQSPASRSHSSPSTGSIIGICGGARVRRGRCTTHLPSTETALHSGGTTGGASSFHTATGGWSISSVAPFAEDTATPASSLGPPSLSQLPLAGPPGGADTLSQGRPAGLVDGRNCDVGTPTGNAAAASREQQAPVPALCEPDGGSPREQLQLQPPPTPPTPLQPPLPQQQGADNWGRREGEQPPQMPPRIAFEPVRDAPPAQQRPLSDEASGQLQGMIQARPPLMEQQQQQHVPRGAVPGLLPKWPVARQLGIEPGDRWESEAATSSSAPMGQIGPGQKGPAPSLAKATAFEAARRSLSPSPSAAHLPSPSVRSGMSEDHQQQQQERNIQSGDLPSPAAVPPTGVARGVPAGLPTLPASASPLGAAAWQHEQEQQPSAESTSAVGRLQQQPQQQSLQQPQEVPNLATLSYPSSVSTGGPLVSGRHPPDSLLLGKLPPQLEQQQPQQLPPEPHPYQPPLQQAAQSLPPPPPRPSLPPLPPHGMPLRQPLSPVYSDEDTISTQAHTSSSISNGAAVAAGPTESVLSSVSATASATASASAAVVTTFRLVAMSEGETALPATATAAAAPRWLREAYDGQGAATPAATAASASEAAAEGGNSSGGGQALAFPPAARPFASALAAFRGPTSGGGSHGSNSYDVGLAAAPGRSSMAAGASTGGLLVPSPGRPSSAATVAVGSGAGSCSGAASGSGCSSGARAAPPDVQLWSNPLLKVVVGETPPMEDVDLYISPDDLQLNTLIGKGASGEVYHALWRGQEVAVKKLMDGHPPHQQPSEMRTLLQEMAILARARHPNIVRCYGGCLRLPQVFLVEELLVCSLHDFIYHPHGDHSPLKLLGLARDVALGLAYLHPTILHRDLKPSNILLDMNGRAKIADFGLARYKLRTHLSTRNLEAGTTPYLPPEVFDQHVKHLTDRSDVYSLGMIMWELFARQPPWHNMRDVAIAYNVHVNRARPALPPQDKCPPRLARLIQACWSHRPRDRPSAAEVVKELTLTITQLEMQ